MIKQCRPLSMRIPARRLALTAALTGIAAVAQASPALANAGGVPHGSPNTCGVGAAEAAAFILDPTLPGVSEISLYSPVAFGCTGGKSGASPAAS